MPTVAVLQSRLMASTGPAGGPLSMDAPQAAQKGQPKLNGQQQAPPRRKASVSLHNDADLESNIKDQLAAVSQQTSLHGLGLMS